MALHFFFINPHPNTLKYSEIVFIYFLKFFYKQYNIFSKNYHTVHSVIFLLAPSLNLLEESSVKSIDNDNTSLNSQPSIITIPITEKYTTIPPIQGYLEPDIKLDDTRLTNQQKVTA